MRNFKDITIKTRGFTLVELMMVMIIIAVLVGLLYPAIRNARDDALQEECANNLRQLYQAMVMYANDNDGYFPSGPGWAWDLWPNYINDDSVFDCPAHPNDDHAGDHIDPDYYFHNGEWGSNLHPLSVYDRPQDITATTDLLIMWCYDAPHDGGQNILNTSGRVYWEKW